MFTDVWFGIGTSNGRKWRKPIPLKLNTICVVDSAKSPVYLRTDLGN